jgi:hypothetical protein
VVPTNQSSTVGTRKITFVHTKRLVVGNASGVYGTRNHATVAVGYVWNGSQLFQLPKIQSPYIFTATNGMHGISEDTTTLSWLFVYLRVHGTVPFGTSIPPKTAFLFPFVRTSAIRQACLSCLVVPCTMCLLA